MILNDEQLGWIVQEVVRCLRAELEDDAPSITLCPRTVERDTLTLDQHVVATETLHGKLDGVKRVKVVQRTVITPAAIDLLRDRGVEIVRETTL